MSDARKRAFAKARVIAAMKAALGGKVPNAKAGGATVVTNANSVSRFPLPVTIGGAVLAAIGALLVWKGHKVSGVLIMGAGGLTLGAAAAAPELQAQLTKLQGDLKGGGL